MKAVKYGLWAATLFIASWALTLISAVVANKGGIVRVAGTDEVPLPEAEAPMTAWDDPHSYQNEMR
jgi:ABC-type microcin C transport system permease subunit YejE